MQSSFRVIKNDSVNHNGRKEIQTDISISNLPNSEAEAILEGETTSELKSENMVNYENLANSIIEIARRKSEQIISDTYIRAQQIEQEASERGYENGEKQGYSEAYGRAYEEYVLKAQCEAEEIINNAHEVANHADSMLLKSKLEYENYINEKKIEIKDLVIEIVNNILHKEVQAEDAINHMVIDALNQVKSGKTFIIKCNSNYVEALKAEIEKWKKQLTFKCEVFVIEDDTVDLGNAVVEKDNGHLEVGIDVGFAVVKKILEEND